jgi:Ca-activated chloride channel homolog
MPAAAQDSPKNPPPETFRVDVRLVRMLVTVKNAMGELVGSLDKEDFVITDNGVAQEPAIFERQTSQPLSVAVLVDTSLSTISDGHYKKASVQKFLKALLAEGNPADTAALYSFSDDVTVQAPYTRQLAHLERAIGAMQAHGATALYDALYLTSRDLERRDGRHVVIVVSDGGDTTSRIDFQGAVRALQRANAVVYAVLVVPIPGDAGRNLKGENALITLSSWTGGKIFFPTAGKALDQVFQEILRDLRTQYLIAYYPKGIPYTKEKFHKVNVDVGRPNLIVSARNGYFADDAPPGTSGSASHGTAVHPAIR